MDELESHHVHCPYCGRRIELVVDPSAGRQEYVEDCSVCCRPIVVRSDGSTCVEVRTEDD